MNDSPADKPVDKTVAQPTAELPKHLDSFSGGEILETGDILATYKPSGWLVHNSRYAGPREHTLTDWLRQTSPEAVPLHRLDRGTSGIVLFAANPRAAKLGQELMEGAEKKYLLIARGRLAADCTLEHPVDVDGVKKDATTSFRLLAHAADPRVCLLESTLKETGRRHQIRRHAKHLSHPLVGDVKYGKGPLNRLFRTRYGFHRLALHAFALNMRPGAIITCPPPPDFRSILREVFDDIELEESKHSA